MTSKAGINPNAAPFVPGKLRVGPPAQASAPPPAPSHAPPQFAPGPPPPFTGMPPVPYYPSPMHPQVLYPPLPHLYPGYQGGPPMHVGNIPPQPQPKPTYNSILRSKGNPSSPLVTPPANAAQFQNKPQGAAAAAEVLPTLSKPLVVLILGPRGSGKTTQVKLIAERFNLLPFFSGDVVRAGRQPMPELRRIVEENFGPSVPKPRKYNGIALDRCITAGEMDVYYLQWALSAAPEFGVPLTFLLMIDWEAAMSRAEARDAKDNDSKPKSMQRRMIEHRAQFDACENMYAPLKLLHRIDCEDQSIAAVSGCIENIVKDHVTAVNNRTFAPAMQLPARFFDGDIATMKAIIDYNLFHSLKVETHGALHSSTSVDYAPVSQMSTMVEPTLFDSTKKRRYMGMSFATLKADGKRLLLVKHKERGMIGFPQSFQCAYDLNLMFVNYTWPAAPATAAAATASTSSIEFILDCELVRTKRPAPTIMVFDFVYFFGDKGTKLPFSNRLGKLVAFFNAATIVNPAEGGAVRPVELKEYVPINQLRKLLPDFSKPPFPIDGIVLQADALYEFGSTKEIMKWKPSDQCTVDFRLFGGAPPSKECPNWVFTGKVQVVHPDKSVDEETYPNCAIHISNADVEMYNLSDGAVVECVKCPPQAPAPAASQQSSKGAKVNGAEQNKTPQSVWKFVRLRADRMLPNRLEVAQSIERLTHMTYEQLLQTCDGLH